MKLELQESNIHFIERNVPWTSITQWAWPKKDTELLKAFYDVMNIEQLLKYVPINRRNICVQAGGACGVWPLRFSKVFNFVYTFEPSTINYTCLLENTKTADNIFKYNLGLSDSIKSIDIVYSEEHQNNCGAGYIVENKYSNTKTIALDYCSLLGCDLLQLDVEGAELEALKGASNLISKYKPIICLEVKILPYTRKNNINPEQSIIWLEKTFNYKKVCQIHRDIVLIP